ncbi:hypothetical protein BDA99DRAFT_322495 [Phascolomyces articulosus]|uniref:SAP domain-containing protein n=1 Tax=Phascolomyces articulosus TaxID=60185 RepID=A0AAD5KGW8_9FUNG|nr:hypothetical protein BDA99DRAFT_322495 [Phascolomyces articulosus]
MLPDDLSKLRVVDLKAELTQRKLPTKGKKDELIARLQQWLDENKDQDQNNGQQIEEEQQQQEEESQSELAPATAINEQQKEASPQTEAAEEKKQIDSSPMDEDTNKPSDAEVVSAPAPPVEKEPQPATTEPMNTEEEVKPTEPEPVPVPTAPVEEPKPVEQQETPMESTPVEEEKKKETKEETSAESTEPINEDLDIKGTKRKRLEPEARESPEKRSKARTEETAEKQDEKQTNSDEKAPVKRFWMDAIKTHCYVIYESEKEAQDAFSGIDGIVFPRDTGRKVQVGGLTPEQAETLIGQEQAAASKSMKLDWEKAIKAAVRGEVLESSPTPTDQGEARRHRLSGIGQITRELQKAATASVLAPGSALPPAVEERSVHLVQTDTSSGKLEQQQEPSVSAPAPTASLDELFRKTTTLPNLYYLPVAESVAKQRLEKLK